MMAHGCELGIDAATFDKLIAKAPKYRRTIKDTIKHKLLLRQNEGFSLRKRKR